MRPGRAAAILLFAGTTVFAHRLDEYLQATIISIDKHRVDVQMTLTPGVIVFPFLISSIDTDGGITETERQAYAERVLHDLSLAIDGHRLTPQLLSIRVPTMDEMKEGRGEIQIDFKADLPAGARRRSLTFENHHQSRIAAYQVNCLVPHDPEIRITSQNRNYTQSQYRLEYMQTNVGSAPISLASWSGWLGLVALVLFTRVALGGIGKAVNRT